MSIHVEPFHFVAEAIVHQTGLSQWRNEIALEYHPPPAIDFKKLVEE